MKYLCTVMMMAAAFTVSACSSQQSAANLPPGKYETKTMSTDANDTTVEKDTSTTVGYDAYGNKRAVVQSKTTTDPKGLFNKTTTESDQVIPQQ